MFRSAQHIGEVMVAYVGDLKKQPDFSGDVMSTTARICGHAKPRGRHLFMSKAVYDILPNKPDGVQH